MEVRDGSKGPLVVEIIKCPVAARTLGGKKVTRKSRW